jgi:hypothetical protein
MNLLTDRVVCSDLALATLSVKLIEFGAHVGLEAQEDCVILPMTKYLTLHVIGPSRRVCIKYDSIEANLRVTAFPRFKKLTKANVRAPT